MIGHQKMSQGGAFMPFNSEHRKFAKAQTEALNQVTKKGATSQSECLVPISRELCTINSKKDEIERAARNIIFVRDLSAKATENQLRAVFSEFDVIKKVAFHRFNNPDGLPNLQAPPFAEITYASDKGVTEASKMSGLLVAGTPCTVTVVNPNLDIASKSDETKPERVQTMVTYTPCKELNRSDVDLQVAKTIHISGLSSWMTEITVKEVLEQCFGTVIECRVDQTPDGKYFALAEFSIMQSAMLALRQKQVAMELGEENEKVIWELTPSRALAHEQKVVEKAVSFSQTTIMVNAYGGLDYGAVQQAFELNDKLAQVQRTAFELGIQSATHPDGTPKTEREKLREKIAMMEAKIARKKADEEEERQKQDEEKQRKKEKKEKKEKKKRDKRQKKEREKDKRSKKRSKSSSSSRSSSSSSRKKDKKSGKRDNSEILS